MKYIQLTEGDILTVEKGAALSFACCDCGLVHKIKLINHRREIDMLIVRDNRKTAQKRRYMKR